VMVVEPATVSVESATFTLNAADLTVAEAIHVTGATLALTAADVSIREVQLMYAEGAPLSLSAADVTIIGQESRTPAASVTLWEQVRVRAGA